MIATRKRIALFVSAPLNIRHITKGGNMILRFVPVEGNEFYYASADGDIYSLAKGVMKKMTPRIQRGYPYVCVHLNGKQKMVAVHRWVYIAFHGKIADKMQIDHVDCNKLNSSISNLEMVTPSENQKRAANNGLRQKIYDYACDKNSNFQKAATLSRRKNNLKKRKKVRCVTTNTIYESILQASKETNITRVNLVKCCNKKIPHTKHLVFEWVN